MYKFMLVFGCLLSFKAITMEEMGARLNHKLKLEKTIPKEKEALQKLTTEKIEKYYNAWIFSPALDDTEIQKEENLQLATFAAVQGRDVMVLLLYWLLDTKKTKIDCLIGELLEILEGEELEDFRKKADSLPPHDKTWLEKAVLDLPELQNESACSSAFVKLRQKLCEISMEACQEIKSFHEKAPTRRDPSFTESEWKFLENKSYDLTRLIFQEASKDYDRFISEAFVRAYTKDDPCVLL